MNRHIRSVAVALATAAVLVAGACGSSGAGKSGTSGQSGQKTTVTFMTWETAATNKLIDQAVKKFKDPNITIQRLDTPSGNYSAKLSSLTQARKLPDIFWCGNDTEQQYSSLGLLTDWSKSMGGNFAAKQFGGLQNWTTDKGIGGLPSLRNVYGIWYDADAFQAAHLKVPASGWTWDEMYADADALKGKNGAKFGLVAGSLVSTDAPFTMGAYSKSAGGQPFTDNVYKPTTVQADAQFTQGVTLLRQHIMSGAIAPPGYDTSNSTSLFEAGKVPMLMGGQWLAANFINDKTKIKWGFAPLPVVNTPVTLYDAVGMCTPSYTKNPAATFKVLKFLDSTVMKEVNGESPVAPPAYEPARASYFAALKKADAPTVAETAKADLDATSTVGVRFTTTWASKAADLTTADYLPILEGKKPVSDLQSYVSKIQALIKQGS